MDKAAGKLNVQHPEGKAIESGFFRTGSMVILIAGFAVLKIAEEILPLRSMRRPRMGRYTANAAMTLLGLAAGAAVVRPAALGLAMLSSDRSWGLLNAAALPDWAIFAAGFLLMDLTFYYWHRLNHSIHFLWRFHSVHHIDPDMDVTTSLRFHFGEVLLSTVFRAVQVPLLGIAPSTYVVYELVFTLAAMFHHSNILMPVDAERRVNRVLVTPRMHGVHHSVVRSELNSNYSVIFRWWDALNGSLVLNVPQSSITIGVGRFQRPEDNGIWRLILLPFGMFRKEKPPRPPRFGKSDLGTMAQ